MGDPWVLGLPPFYFFRSALRSVAFPSSFVFLKNALSQGLNFLSKEGLYWLSLPRPPSNQQGSQKGGILRQRCTAKIFLVQYLHDKSQLVFIRVEKLGLAFH